MSTAINTDWISSPRKPISREFLADAPLRPRTVQQRRGYSVQIRLTSYRSLPLSCIESIALRINGVEIDPESLVLILGGNEYRPVELAVLGDRWWFILDYAELFFPHAAQLGPGPHAFDGTLVTVEPYMTAGRFSFTHRSSRSLRVADSSAAGI